jgi:hypothetical protein
MVKLDFRRLFTSKFFYIIIGSCLIVPILILVMTKMMEGSPMTDQYGNPMLDEFGNPVLMEGFKNVWQMLGSVGGAENAMSMDLTSMCNINMVFMTITVLISLFVSQEFRSGYSKNLFTVRSNKTDYVISKTLIGFIGGMLMVLSFFVGQIIWGIGFLLNQISNIFFIVQNLNNASGCPNVIAVMVSESFLRQVPCNIRCADLFHSILPKYQPNNFSASGIDMDLTVLYIISQQRMAKYHALFHRPGLSPNDPTGCFATFFLRHRRHDRQV